VKAPKAHLRANDAGSLYRVPLCRGGIGLYEEPQELDEKYLTSDPKKVTCRRCRTTRVFREEQRATRVERTQQERPQVWRWQWRCKATSSVSEQRCLLRDGHPMFSPTRFHKFEPEHDTNQKEPIR
jgi:hypothetical protein